MRRAVALTSMALAALPGPGHAAPPSDLDFMCGMSFEVAYDHERLGMDEVAITEIDGGPIRANGTLTCAVQLSEDRRIGTPGSRHSDPEVAVVSGSGTDGVTFVPPAVVAYRRPFTTVVWLCDAFTDESGTEYVYDYHDGAWEPAAGNDEAMCRYAIWTGTGDPDGPPVIVGMDAAPCALADCPPEAEALQAEANALICPDLGDEEDPRGGDGDVYIWFVRVWDCPPEGDQDYF